jgi:hypothetical protein
MKNLLVAVFTFLTISAQAQVTSTFDSNADGWTFLNNGTPVTVKQYSIDHNHIKTRAYER